MHPNHPRLGFFVDDAPHTCFYRHWEGAAVTFDPAITNNTTAMLQHLLSLHRLSEAFFAALPPDIRLGEPEWDAIEHAVSALQQAVNIKVGQLLDALNVLRGEWAGGQWEGVVLGLLMAQRPDLFGAHPSIENAWVRLQAQQLLRQLPPDPHAEPGETQTP
jgi:hypothetical protein